MKWFKNLKIKVKLISCFLILAIFTAVVGIIGILNMSTINQRTEDMYNNNFQPAQQLAAIQKNLLLIRSNILLMVYEKDTSKLQQRTAEINKWAEEDTNLLKEYELTIRTDEERELYNTLNENLGPYREIRSEFLKMLQEGKYDEAAARIPEFAKAREAVDSGVAGLIAVKTKLAQNTSKTNATDFRNQSVMMIVTIILGVLLAIILGVFIANIISKPLKQLVGIANQIAAGDLDVTVDIDTKDEVGVLSKAFKNMAENINQVMMNINTAAEQVASGSKQLSDSSIVLSQGATEQASSIEELTASIEEISSQTRQNADNAKEANVLAETAKTNAMQGNDQMREMLKAMGEINDSSSNIYKIIKVIDEIAFQTNILALNAAVEAARAGQHGKGFAVVAEEVRNLAARSANAAKETADMIEGSIKKVESGTKIANETAAALNKIVDGIAKAASLVGNIAVASNEQATGISQINQGIMQVSQVVQTNSATSEESAAASEELSSQAALLKEQVGKFKLKYKYPAYNGLDEINPDVLRSLESMNGMKKTASPLNKSHAETAATGSSKIILSDREFGKY